MKPKIKSMNLKIYTILTFVLASANLTYGQDTTNYSSEGLSVRLRLLYANYSGTEPLLPTDITANPNNNLNGDGFGFDVIYGFKKFDIGLTASSVLFLAKEDSYLAAAFISKSLRRSKWQLSFGSGFGGISLYNIVENERILRPAINIQAHADYFITPYVFIGMQVQSWIALGPEDDLGLSSASFGLGYKF